MGCPRVTEATATALDMASSSQLPALVLLLALLSVSAEGCEFNDADLLYRWVHFGQKSKTWNLTERDRISVRFAAGLCPQSHPYPFVEVWSDILNR